MERQFEIFDAWMKAQQDFMDSWTRAQRDFWENMTESARKMQEAFLCQLSPMQREGEQGPPEREAFGFFNKMTESMVNTSKSYMEEVMRMQDAWRVTIDKQMEMGRRAAANFFEIGRRKEQKEQGESQEAA